MSTIDDLEETENFDAPSKNRTRAPEEFSKWTIFKAGWRPALGWLSVCIVFYSFIIHPGIVWYVTLAGYEVIMPLIDASALLNLVAIFISVGAMRTFEKINYNDKNKDNDA